MSASLRCLVCGDPAVPGDDLACASCGAPHHRDCWEFGEGCSIYGCGGREASPLGTPSSGSLVLAEGDRVPAPRAGRGTALARRLRQVAPQLPETVGLGLGGTVLGSALLTGLGWMGGGWGTYLEMAAAGAAYGLLVPFLAPTLHRRPGAVAGVAFLVHLLCWTAFELLSGASLPLRFLQTTSWLISWMLVAAGLSEVLVGPRTRTGQALGRASGVVRLLVMWLAAAALFPVVGLLQGQPIPLDLFGFAAVIGLQILVAGCPALERGKQRYLERLPPGRR